MSVRVQEADFDVSAEIDALCAGRADVGAVATFIGLVRDVNDGGARIILPSSQALSGPLVLSIRHRRADYPADIVWRAGSAAGLRFLGASRLN